MAKTACEQSCQGTYTSCRTTCRSTFGVLRFKARRDCIRDCKITEGECIADCATAISDAEDDVFNNELEQQQLELENSRQLKLQLVSALKWVLVIASVALVLWLIFKNRSSIGKLVNKVA